MILSSPSPSNSEASNSSMSRSSILASMLLLSKNGRLLWQRRFGVFAQALRFPPYLFTTSFKLIWRRSIQTTSSYHLEIWFNWLQQQQVSTVRSIYVDSDPRRAAEIWFLEPPFYKPWHRQGKQIWQSMRSVPISWLWNLFFKGIRVSFLCWFTYNYLQSRSKLCIKDKLAVIK